MKLSIITPSFNQGTYLPRMLDSVAGQTQLPHEHIIFDARSTDGSVDILEEYCRSVEFATLKVEEDRGPADAINRGLAASTGDLLAWLNTDDGYLSVDVLETIVGLFENHPEVDVVYGRAHYVDPDGRFIKPFFVQSDAENLENTLIHSVGIPQPTVFFRRRVYERIGALDLSFSCAFDYDYWIRITKSGLKFMFVDRELAYATLHDESITASFRVQQLQESVCAVKKNFNFASSEWIERLVLRKDYGLDSLFQAGNRDSIKNDEAFLNSMDDVFRYYNRSDEAIRAIVLSSRNESTERTRKQLLRCNLFNSERVLVAAFDSAFFESGLTLIAGLHRFEESYIPIFVYDFGLTSGQREKLCRFSQVFLVDIPKEINSHFDNYPKTKSYFLKTFVMHDISEYLEKGDLVLWCDAGVFPLQPLNSVFDIISSEEVFFIDHDDVGTSSIYNIEFTHPRALELLSATSKEMLALHLRSSFMGYKVGGRFQRLFEESYAYSQDYEIICWNKHPSKEDDVLVQRPSSRPGPAQVEELRRRAEGDRTEGDFTLLAQHFPYSGHRQDQSVFSILASRYDAKLHSARRFCRSNRRSSQNSLSRWKGQPVVSEHKFLQGMDRSVVTYQHRCSYINHDGLIFNCRASDLLVVLGNGPSLKGFDFGQIESFDTIGMNAAYRHWDRIGWYPRYYICLDLVVGLSHKEAIARLIRESDSNGIRYFVLRRNLVDCLPDLEDHPRILVFDDMQKSSSFLQGDLITTGSHAALVGCVLGYRRIYLLGVDCNYVDRVVGSREVERNVLEIVVDSATENPNYFIEDYQQIGDQFHIPNVYPDVHLNSWRSVKNKLKSTGVTVLNANRHSKVDAFPFCDFKDIEHVLKGPYERKERAHIDEAELIARLFAGQPVEPVMIDVGAHHGGSAHRFLQRGWKIFAFEPDSTNRRELQKKFGSHPMMTIDPRAIGDQSYEEKPFFTSAESSGISGLLSFHDTHKQTATVPVTSLRNVVEEYEISKVDFLKIDTEGYDLMVLKGFPWEDLQPQVILCEFEDSKTGILGYAFHDLATFLLDKEYVVFVSEWHPVARYGVRHDWRRLVSYPCQLENPEAWGNLIAFRNAPDSDVLRAVAKEIVEADRTKTVPTPPPLELPSPVEPAAVPKSETGIKMERLGFAVRLAGIGRNRHVRSFVAKRLASPTAVGLFGGLALVGAGIAGGAGSVWLAVAGLAPVGLIVMKEAVLWRWRRERDRAQAGAALAEAVRSERGRSERALAEALATERERAEKALAEAVRSERGRSERALAEALATERERAEKALAEAVRSERDRRSLVDVHLADRELAIRRILLLFTMVRSGSTWLFDMLRTHPAVRVEPTARVWTALGMDGWRYPGAFHHADGAAAPLEFAPGRGAAIPAFPRADLPDAPPVDEADRWAIEKAHPSFVGFESGRLAARLRDLRQSGVEVEVVYGLRNPLDAMRSMAEYKARDPEWLSTLPVGETPRFVARSLDALAELRALVGGTVIEYENLPDGAAMGELCRRLAPEWRDAEVKSWLAHAAAVTDRPKHRQSADAGFFGERGSGDPAGPDGAWADRAADIEAAKATHRRLVAGRHEGTL